MRRYNKMLLVYSMGYITVDPLYKDHLEEIFQGRFFLKEVAKIQLTNSTRVHHSLY